MSHAANNSQLFSDFGDLFEPKAVPSFSPPGGERRSAGRFLVRWRAKVFAAGHASAYEGVTCDLSQSGASIYMDHNLSINGGVLVQLVVPAALSVPGLGRANFVEAEALHVYSILDSVHKRFRIGVKFLKFKSGEQAMLQRLALSEPVPF